MTSLHAELLQVEISLWLSWKVINVEWDKW